MHRIKGNYWKKIIAMTLLMSISFSNIVLAEQTTESTIEYSNEYDTAWKLIQMYKEGTNEATIHFSKNSDKIPADNQGILKMAQSIAMATSLFDGVRYKLRVSYKPNSNSDFDIDIRTEESSLFRWDEVQLKVKEIAQLARDYSSNKRKQVEFVNSYLVDNAYYDKESQLSKDESKGAWQAYGVLLNGKGVCMSYTYAMCLILQELDIPVVNIREENHIYNRVYVDHQWYNLDTTFNDPILNGKWSSEAAKDLAIRESKGEYTLVSDDVILAKGRVPVVDVEKIQQAKYPELTKDTDGIKELKTSELGIGKDSNKATNLDIICLVGLKDGKYTIPENFESYIQLCDATFTNLKDKLNETQRACVGYAIERGIVSEGVDKTLNYNKVATKKEMVSVLLRLRGIDNISWNELEKTSVYKDLGNYREMTVGAIKEILFIGSNIK